MEYIFRGYYFSKKHDYSFNLYEIPELLDKEIEYVYVDVFKS